MRWIVVLVVGGSIGLALVPSSLSTKRRAPLSAKSVQQCLLKDHVTNSVSSVSRKLGKYLPPGVLDRLAIIGFVPGLPSMPGEPRVDDGTLWFFKNATLAEKGEAKIVSVWVYGKGLPPFEATLIHKPPNAAVARSLYRLVGNVIVVWQYPRSYKATSSKVINDCLR